MPDTTAFEELPDLLVSASAPLGGKNLGGTSRLAKKDLGGTSQAAERKRDSANKASQLVNILKTFVGIE